jgi:peptidoglycan/xylan/chitin deacetylase (PgdA/CDA1 family)
MTAQPDLGTPLLVVRAPEGRDAERRYALDLVLGEWLGLGHVLVTDPEPHLSIRLAGDSSGRTLIMPDILLNTSSEAWLTEHSLPRRPLSQVRPPLEDAGSVGPQRDVALPVLFGDVTANGLAWQEMAAGLALSVDIFGSIFFLVSRMEEIIRTERDGHARFPTSASIAHAEGFVERPLADEYVDLLFAALRALWPAIERRPTEFRLRLTHDIDRPFAALGLPAWRIARSLGADVAIRREPRLAFRRLRAAADARTGRVDRDPSATFDFLMSTSERHGLRSTFYFMAGNEPGDGDYRYRLNDPHFAPILREIHERGHEIGLHGSYISYDSPERIRAEATALLEACRAAGFDQPAWGVRQHYLRFANPATWQHQETAGLNHDSTMGFVEHVGFRSGTCREHPVYDLLERRPLALRERPLIVMDASLFGYMGLDVAQAGRRTRDVVDACRRHHGDAVVLYHNDTVAGARQQGQYRELVEDLV